MEQPIVDRFLPPQVQLSDTIHKFWADMHRLIRVYLVRTLFNINNQESKDAINENLDRVSNELRSLLVRYYDEDIGNQIKSDLLNYIYHIEQMIDAYANKDENAIALHRGHLDYLTNIFAQNYALINNYLDRAVIQELFHASINSIENQAVSIINGDYTRDLDEYEAFMNIAYRLADEFTYGILRQFFYGSEQ